MRVWGEADDARRGEFIGDLLHLLANKAHVASDAGDRQATPPLGHRTHDLPAGVDLAPQLGLSRVLDDLPCQQYALHKDGFLVPVVENLSGARRPNLSEVAVAYLAGLGVDPSPASAAMLWHHALATLYSPAHLAENAGGSRQGWPRVPLPTSLAVLQSSAALGAQLAALLDPDTAVPDVTMGTLRPELACIGVPTTRPGSKWIGS